MFHSVTEIVTANRARGHFFFEPSTLRFFKSRLSYELFHGRYFVTSEKGPDGVRAYSVRKANDDGSIDTVGDFQAYATLAAAKRAAKGLV